MIPDNWYGGPTVGNRYFLNLLPLGLFLVPRGRETLVAVAGALASALLLLPVLLSPLHHSHEPRPPRRARVVPRSSRPS